MTVRRIRTEHPIGPRGFSRWVHPIPHGYLLACCDCGLVHELEFRIRHDAPEFRARRARNHTAQERRRRKIVSPFRDA